MRGLHQPTSNDVARKAGVSRATVSVVLNGTRSNMRVSEATRQKVLAAAADLGYSPHPIAQALRCQQSRLIGFVPRPSRAMPFEHPMPYELSIHISQAATAHGYHVIEVDAENYASQSGDELARFLLSRRVDGIIFDAPDTAQQVQRVIDRARQPRSADRRFPIVQIMRPQLSVETATITVDARPGIEDAVAHLVALGHRRIAFVGHGGSHPIDRMRRDCFLSALARRQIVCPPTYLQLGPEYSLEQGYACTRALLALSERPTAVLVASDTQVLGAMRALYEAHVRVPDAISVISFDDAVAGYLYPPLTSVAQPLKEVAACAVSFLVESIETAADGLKESEHVILPTRLAVRDSTAAIGEGRTGELGSR